MEKEEASQQRGPQPRPVRIDPLKCTDNNEPKISCLAQDHTYRCNQRPQIESCFTIRFRDAQQSSDAIPVTQHQMGQPQQHIHHQDRDQEERAGFELKQTLGKDQQRKTAQDYRWVKPHFLPAGADYNQIGQSRNQEGEPGCCSQTQEQAGHGSRLHSLRKIELGHHKADSQKWEDQCQMEQGFPVYTAKG